MKTTTILFVVSFISCQTLNIRIKPKMGDLRLSTCLNTDLFLGYITSMPQIVDLKNKTPNVPPFKFYSGTYCKFEFNIVEVYIPSKTKELWDNINYHDYRSRSYFIDTTVLIPHRLRDTIITLYYPIEKKSEYKRLKNCYSLGTLILSSSVGTNTSNKNPDGFTSELYNFHPSFLDSLTAAWTYKVIEPD